MNDEDRRESVDPTAPASTYYTSGRNSRHRTRTYTVMITSFVLEKTSKFTDICLYFREVVPQLLVQKILTKIEIYKDALPMVKNHA